MNIVGVDLSTTRIGISTNESSFSISRPKGKGLFSMKDMEKMVFQVEAATANASVVMIEENIVGRAVHVSTMWLHGVVRMGLHLRGIPFVEVHPSRRAKWACGDQKGRGKDDILLRAHEWDPSVTNNDEADACILRLMGEQAYGIGKGSEIPMTKYRQEVLAAMMWPEVDGRVVAIPPLTKRKPK